MKLLMCIEQLRRCTGSMICMLPALLLCMTVRAQVVNVSTAAQLQNALSNAQPGQTIIIADGLYDSPGGNFTVPIGVNGTDIQPITLQGGRNAILTTNDSAHGYGLWLKGSKYWILKGFTARYCKNGIMIDSSQYITIDSVQAKKCGQSGIALRKWSSFCTVKNCFTDSLGLLIPGQGEGIYVGSAYSNWPDNTGGAPDTCNYNQILNNTFGSAIPAENIDIKEGTTGGLVKGNIFNGKGLSNQNGADSWIDVKGNYWTIEDNTGTDTYLDGFQTHITYAGWGNYNVFRNNQLNVNAPGYGIRVITSGSAGTAYGNIVCNNNIATSAGLGMTNITPATCSMDLQRYDEQVLFDVVCRNRCLTIHNNTSTAGTAQVYDIQSRNVSVIHIQPGANSFDWSQLTPGIYYIRLVQRTAAVNKIVKVCLP